MVQIMSDLICGATTGAKITILTSKMNESQHVLVRQAAGMSKLITKEWNTTSIITFLRKFALSLQKNKKLHTINSIICNKSSKSFLT